MSAGRICTREVHLVDPNETVGAAAERMRRRRVGSLLVLDGARRPVGMVTDRDLAVRALGTGRGPDTPVRDVMTGDVVTVRDDAPIEDVLSLMRSGPYRRIPVVDAAGALVGIVSVDDVVDLLADELERIAALLGRQAPPPLVGAG